MQTKNLTKDKTIRQTALYLALLFCLFTIVFFIVKKEYDKSFMALISILYVFIPTIAQKLFKFRISPWLYVSIIVYAICPLLGFSYNFYYNLAWWDDILHAFAGVIFAMLGAYLPKVMTKDGEPSVALCAFSAFFFSVAIAGLWELVEFSMDSFFGTDMQKDTQLFAMRPSYVLSELLGADTGVLLEMKDVQVLVDGKLINGYVDLGLLDTMKDIFVETLGALVYFVIYCAGKGKYFVFERAADAEEALPQTEEVPVGAMASELAVSEEKDEE